MSVPHTLRRNFRIIPAGVGGSRNASWSRFEVVKKEPIATFLSSPTTHTHREPCRSDPRAAARVSDERVEVWKWRENEKMVDGGREGGSMDGQVADWIAFTMGKVHGSLARAGKVKSQVSCRKPSKEKQRSDDRPPKSRSRRRGRPPRAEPRRGCSTTADSSTSPSPPEASERCAWTSVFPSTPTPFALHG